MTISKPGWHSFRVSAAGDYAPGALAGTVPATLNNMRPAVVKEVIVNNAPVAGNVELYDVAQQTGASGVPAVAAAKVVLKIADIPAGTPGYVIPVDIEFKAGLFMRTTAASDITLVYRPMGRTSPLVPNVFVQRR